jgi:hypothetical protein
LYRSAPTNGGLRDESFDVAPLVTDWLAEGMYLGVREDLQPSQSELPIPDWPWRHFAPIIDAIVTSALTAGGVSRYSGSSVMRN